jgi:hypothetical protein
MLFIFSTPVLIRHLWQLKTVVFLHWCQICALPRSIGNEGFQAVQPTQIRGKHSSLFCCNHRDRTRLQMPAKIFPHLILKCLLFMGLTLGFDTNSRNSFLIKFGVFYNKNKILTILFIVNYEKITLQ